MRQIAKVIGSIAVGVALATSCFAADLTALEIKWLDAADPVLRYALDQGLPIDVIVQPDSNADDVPLAAGVQGRRCKLVLSMRNRTDAEATLAGVSAEQHAILIEAMTAHEIAHCWRYLRGMWNILPAGFIEPLDPDDTRQIAEKKRKMRTVRREEGFADLAALAWTQLHHPSHYAQVHAWLTGLRHEQPLAGSYHDTRAWLKLVDDPQVFAPADTPFEQVQELWAAGLRGEQ